MTITAPSDTTTVGDIIDGEERPCAGETFESLASAIGEIQSLLAASRAGDVEPGYRTADEAELPRVLEEMA